MSWEPITPAGLLGESPFWHTEEQRLYWVDIASRTLHRTAPGTDGVETWPMPSEPGCIAPARSHGQSKGLVIALRDGIYRAPSWGGELKRLVAAPYDSRHNRFNDGKADTHGRFWVGTLYEPRDAAQAQLFSLQADAASGHAPPRLQFQAGEATVANGLAWSPDSSTLYWGDTSAHQIKAWDFDAQRNTLSRPRLFHQWPRKPADWVSGMPGYGGRPDGAAVDCLGNYYVAMFEGARLLKLSPQGKVLADWAVPALCPTMPCFGGPDLQTLYLTTARYSRSAQELQAWPLSGWVLAMRVDTPGLPVNFFAH